MSLYLGDQPIAGISTPVQGRVLGQIIQSTIPLTDAGLHLADGSLIDGNGVYKDFYDYMMTDYENGVRISGTLTNNNGVFSGFDNNSYLYIPGVRTNDNTEFVIKFTTGSDITTSQCVIGCEHFLALDVASGKLSSWNWETASAVQFSWSLFTNQTYYVKIICNGNTRTFNISVNGNSYSELGSFTDNTITNNINKLYQFVLGRYSHQASNPFLGSIDVKGCYIKRNNELLWDGSQYSVLPGRYIDETRYQEYMTNYGVCGKYAISYKDKTIRLPYITGIIEGTLNSNHIGNVTEAGLPNITGTSGYMYTYDATGAWKGSLKTNSGGGGVTIGSGSKTGCGTTEFNASKANSIYGNSNTVQPQTINCFYYIVISTLAKTNIEVDIDEIATDLNGKADKDLANINYGSMRSALNSDDIPYIIGTYRNGFSWHNIYSDGWVEQGGRFKTESGTGYKDINLLVEMADTNFDIYVTRGAESTTTNYNVWAQNPNYTASTKMIRVYISNTAAYVYWRVTGRSKT